MERLGQEEILATLRIKCAKEPKLVLLDWAADIDACIDFGKTVWRRTNERELLRAADQTLSGEIAKRVAGKFVTTTLSDDVKNTAGRFAIFRTISAGLDFDFLHKLKRQVSARATECGVGRVYAVEDVVVFRT